MRDGNEDLRELLATARAIHFAYQQDAITLQQAKDRSKPLLRRLNTAIALIAKEFNVKPKFITFHDLGKRL